jgi:hypothetical protein
MNITYGFTDLEIEIAPTLNGMEQVITRVHYKYRATDLDSNIYADYESFHNFDLSEDASFIPFSELTPELVSSWLNEAIDTDILEPYLAIKVEDLLTSKYVKVKAPWETEETVVETILDDSFPPTVQPTVIPEP